MYFWAKAADSGKTNGRSIKIQIAELISYSDSEHFAGVVSYGANGSVAD